MSGQPRAAARKPSASTSRPGPSKAAADIAPCTAGEPKNRTQPGTEPAAAPHTSYAVQMRLGGQIWNWRCVNFREINMPCEIICLRVALEQFCPVPGQMWAKCPVKQADASRPAPMRRRVAARNCSCRSRCFSLNACCAAALLTAAQRRAAPKPLSSSALARRETTSATKLDLAASAAPPGVSTPARMRAAAFQALQRCCSKMTRHFADL